MVTTVCVTGDGGLKIFGDGGGAKSVNVGDGESWGAVGMTGSNGGLTVTIPN